MQKYVEPIFFLYFYFFGNEFKLNFFMGNNLLKINNFSIYLLKMKNISIEEVNDNCSDFKQENIVAHNKSNNKNSSENKIRQNYKKEKIFLSKKTKRSKLFKEFKFPFNNENQKLFNYYTNSFSNNNVFTSFNRFSAPIIINNFFNFMPKKTKIQKKNPIKIIINNYDNLEKSNEEKEPKNELVGTPINTKINYFESQTASTSNSVQNKIINQQENLLPKNKFNVIKDNFDLNDKEKKENANKKRGRKPKTIGKKQHSAFDQDNIIRKIQVHYISFIIDFTNEIIQFIYKNNKTMYFKSINYEFKKTVNHSYIQQLFSKNIGEIVQLRASPKNKKFDENINQIIYNKLRNIEIFAKLFAMSYLEMFNKYYYKNKREIDFFGNKINISQKTNLFNDLLEKNKESAQQIKQIAEEYFCNKNKDSNQIFVIKKNEDESK